MKKPADEARELEIEFQREFYRRLQSTAEKCHALRPDLSFAKVKGGLAARMAESLIANISVNCGMSIDDAVEMMVAEIRDGMNTGMIQPMSVDYPHQEKSP